MWNKLVSSAVVIAAVGAGSAALGCNPIFPSDALGFTDEQMVAAPAADFGHELHRLVNGKKGEWQAVPPARKEGETTPNVEAQTAAGDLADLRAALAERGTAEKEVEWQVEALRAVRSALVSRGENQMKMDVGAALAGLPEEFVDYARGALAYRRGDLEGARQAWATILALPEKERKYRGVWAAYMTGRTYVGKDAEKAAAFFQRARALAKAGGVDTLGLASASLGWEGQGALNRKQYEAAIGLYMEQVAGGGGTVMDLAACARGVLGESPEVMARVARDEMSRCVVTARLLAQADDLKPEIAARWLAAVEGAKVVDAAGADRLAWAAYAAGDAGQAKRWLERVGKESAVSYWVRAKLALRAGNKTAAAEFLAKAAREFPADEKWEDTLWDNSSEGGVVEEPHPKFHVEGELAVLKLGRGQFVEALDLLVRTTYWADAAYVAERVLTADELKKYVDATWPTNANELRGVPAGEAERISAQGPEAWQGTRLRHLLARRLLRGGRWKEARAYFPKEMQLRMDAYVAAIRAGHDTGNSKAERAKNFWEAAKIARKEGLDLLGTELEPDYAIWDGEFEAGSVGVGRVGKINVPTEEERRRVEAEKVPEKRWHYRYVAAEHAWAAALLMPDESAETAAVLNEAGGWLKVHDAKAADKFYKALVKRCGTTELGKKAAELKWFPEEKKE